MHTHPIVDEGTDVGSTRRSNPTSTSTSTCRAGLKCLRMFCQKLLLEPLNGSLILGLIIGCIEPLQKRVGTSPGPHTHMHAHMHTHTCTRTHAHAHSNARARTRAHTHTHAHADALTHKHMHAHTHAHTHVHTHSCSPRTQSRDFGPSVPRYVWRRVGVCVCVRVPPVLLSQTTHAHTPTHATHPHTPPTHTRTRTHAHRSNCWQVLWCVP